LREGARRPHLADRLAPFVSDSASVPELVVAFGQQFLSEANEHYSDGDFRQGFNIHRESPPFLEGTMIHSRETESFETPKNKTGQLITSQRFARCVMVQTLYPLQNPSILSNFSRSSND
jgi:hypothetical protein